MKKMLNKVGKGVVKATKLLIASTIVIFGSAAIWALKHDATITVTVNK